MATPRVAEVRSYSLIEELLTTQGWDFRRPPQGDVLAQHEYKDFPTLRDALKVSGKKGVGGPGIPEYVLLDRETEQPLAVFEAKAYVADLDVAVRDVETYGNAFRDANLPVLAIAVAGTKDDRFGIRVKKWNGIRWVDITYEAKPISWIPNSDELARIVSSPTTFELRPTVPSPEVLKEKAEEINGLLRESGLKDDFRPATIGAIMLGLWKSGGNIRRDAKSILSDINKACSEAFWGAGKPDLAKSLRVDEANRKLAVRARRICEILERLNITTLTAEHDYLGALYEEFFRYTGGNTIGQYFTPRHVTNLMAEMCDIDRRSIVLDPACGTGGFLIAAMQHIQQKSNLPREAVVKIVKKQLIGLEDEPVTAALCVANMILRGDGSTGVVQADCFHYKKYPVGQADVVLMNPPFPHKKTDTPPELFVNRALEGLKKRGVAAIIVPSSLLVKSDKAGWRQQVLNDNSLLAVISLPSELFQPYASSTTAILVFEKGIPHEPQRPVFFCRVENDGFRLKKGVRVRQAGSQMEDVRNEFVKRGTIPGFCSPAMLDVDSGFAPGAYIRARELSNTELSKEAGMLIRDKAGFVLRHAPELAEMLRAIQKGTLSPRPHKEARDLKAQPRTIGQFFDITYGQKELHSKEELEPGNSLIISSSGMDNGCYGFFDFPKLIQTPFVAVPSTGSIGEATVQEFPCGVVDDCLLLFPKTSTPIEALYVAAAILRSEKWRFDYGRKMTPARIAGFPMHLEPAVVSWIADVRGKARNLEQQALQAFGQFQQDRTFVSTEQLSVEEPSERLSTAAVRVVNSVLNARVKESDILRDREEDF